MTPKAPATPKGGERYAGSPWVRVYFDVPREVHARAKEAAAASGVSLKQWFVNLINNATK